MKRIWTVLTVAGLLAVACSSAMAQRYTPPGTGGNPGGSSNPPPKQPNPDPFGLTLAASGAAAAVGYVMRRKRQES